MLSLGGLSSAPSEAIWNSPAELRETQARFDLMRGIQTPIGPRNKLYGDDFPSNPSMKAANLRQILQLDPNQGIEDAKMLLRTNPSDSAVGANLGTIANTESPKAIPFLLSVWANMSASPNMRKNAFYWFSRMNPNKEEVAKAIMDLFAKPETESVGSEALFRMVVADHRAVLEKIANSSNPDKFTVMGKIYRGSSASSLLKSDLLMFISLLNDSRAVPFIVDATQNERDPVVRSAAFKALGNRKDVDVAMLQKLLHSEPPPLRVPQAQRGRGANPAVILPALPVFPPSGTSGQ